MNSLSLTDWLQWLLLLRCWHSTIPICYICFYFIFHVFCCSSLILYFFPLSPPLPLPRLHLYKIKTRKLIRIQNYICTNRIYFMFTYMMHCMHCTMHTAPRPHSNGHLTRNMRNGRMKKRQRKNQSDEKPARNVLRIFSFCSYATPLHMSCQPNIDRKIRMRKKKNENKI